MWMCWWRSGQGPLSTIRRRWIYFYDRHRAGLAPDAGVLPQALIAQIARVLVCRARSGGTVIVSRPGHRRTTKSERLPPWLAIWPSTAQIEAAMRTAAVGPSITFRDRPRVRMCRRVSDWSVRDAVPDHERAGFRSCPWLNPASGTRWCGRAWPRLVGHAAIGDRSLNGARCAEVGDVSCWRLGELAAGCFALPPLQSFWFIDPCDDGCVLVGEDVADIGGADPEELAAHVDQVHPVACELVMQLVLQAKADRVVAEDHRMEASPSSRTRSRGSRRRVMPIFTMLAPNAPTLEIT
jgi:hypothetical protein